MVQVTVTCPPSHSCGAVSEALSFVNCGLHPPAAAIAADCAFTQSVNAVSTAFWSVKSQASRLVSSGSVYVTASAGARLNWAVMLLIVSHVSVMVQVTVTCPPSHSCGAVSEALSFVNCGSHPPAAAMAADWAFTQLVNAVSTAFWSSKSHDSRLVSAGSL